MCLLEMVGSQIWTFSVWARKCWVQRRSQRKPLLQTLATWPHLQKACSEVQSQVQFWFDSNPPIHQTQIFERKPLWKIEIHWDPICHPRLGCLTLHARLHTVLQEQKWSHRSHARNIWDNSWSMTWILVSLIHKQPLRSVACGCVRSTEPQPAKKPAAPFLGSRRLMSWAWVKHWTMGPTKKLHFSWCVPLVNRMFSLLYRVWSQPPYPAQNWGRWPSFRGAIKSGVMRMKPPGRFIGNIGAFQYQYKKFKSLLHFGCRGSSRGSASATRHPWRWRQKLPPGDTKIATNFQPERIGLMPSSKAHPNSGTRLLIWSRRWSKTTTVENL